MDGDEKHLGDIVNGLDGYMSYRLWASPWRQIVEDELRQRNPHKTVRRERKSVAERRLAEVVAESRQWSSKITRERFYREQKRLHQMKETVSTPLTFEQQLAVAIRSLESRKK